MQTADRKELGLRFARVRGHFGLSQKEVGERLGIPWRTYQNYEVGNREPMAMVAAKFCSEFNVRYRWLLLGEGEPFEKSSEESIISLVETVLNRAATLGLDVSSEKAAQIIGRLYRRQMLGHDIGAEDVDDFLELIKEKS